MKIYLINPNTTESMTQKASMAAQSVAAAGTTVIGVQPDMGPASIEGFFDEVFSVPGLIDEMKKAEDADAFIIACFDDTGLEAARCLTDAPVIGIGEAGFHLASLVGHKFGVVTTLARSVPAIENNLLKYGLERRCAGVRASDIPVLELEKNDPSAMARISDEIDKSIRLDGAEAIVLGCAGMTDLTNTLQKKHGVPVIDGVASAVKMAEALVATNVRTSKIGGYATPAKKTFRGIFEPYSPEG